MLDQIIKERKKAVEDLKAKVSLSEFIKQIGQSQVSYYGFKEALIKEKTGIHIIAEVKKTSPSKGVICQDFDPVAIARDYERGGATAISVLTEPNYFGGNNSYLSKIKENVKLPLLRKDFIIDPLQIYEAKAIGADAILLIAAILSPQILGEYLKLARSLGLDCLVETHDEEEVKMALEVGAEIIGVNNRNLQTFEVSLEVSKRLRRLIPDDRLFVAESGIHTQEDIKFLREIGTKVMLIGESVVKASNRVAHLRKLLEA
ncbi:indole-3-glycerol phosphate synthase [Sporanaerobium hydrogeniformans]|uniref:Indole-3-glycerol phosphate synthase n=1 Tax=Sporanaerobium hydrogeniformans TaxID=3072179 RepID=A0AC61DC10_9FIRM|nr:indole-3-glycerol phosphate synthase [Sporanaerobium hydrogeniformans]